MSSITRIEALQNLRAQNAGVKYPTSATEKQKTAFGLPTVFTIKSPTKSISSPGGASATVAVATLGPCGDGGI
jgi:hypothetical protein